MMIGMTPPFLYAPSYQEGELGAVDDHENTHDGDEQPGQPRGPEELPVRTLVLRDHDAEPTDQGCGRKTVTQRPEQGQSGDGPGRVEADGIQVPDQGDPQDRGGSVGQDTLGDGNDDRQGDKQEDKRDTDHGIGQQATDAGGGHDLLEHPDNDDGGD